MQATLFEEALGFSSTFCSLGFPPPLQEHPSFDWENELLQQFNDGAAAEPLTQPIIQPTAPSTIEQPPTAERPPLLDVTICKISANQAAKPPKRKAQAISTEEIVSQKKTAPAMPGLTKPKPRIINIPLVIPSLLGVQRPKKKPRVKFAAPTQPMEDVPVDLTIEN